MQNFYIKRHHQYNLSPQFQFGQNLSPNGVSFGAYKGIKLGFINDQMQIRIVLSLSQHWNPTVADTSRMQHKSSA